MPWGPLRTPVEQVEPPVKLTLSKAAKQLGKSKGTLSRALNSGEMSGTKADDGSWQIDQSELMRWVSTTRSRERVEDRSEPPETPPDPPASASGWEAQMALMRERLDDATATVADLRERLDASEAERRALNQRFGAQNSSARFYLKDEGRYLQALLDYIMISKGLRAKAPSWRIWHPFEDPDCWKRPELRDALLAASDHFPVTLDIDL